ncbi:aminotransferase class V-fold PLP-dependent enzyme [Mesomycoplasma neurolyticum]|uniref:Probable cysteine desulfurase n=1 Tax=Mesomycoplasma neurolyticum TaxID=2120 RepID=A0A449A4X4_9BACT|nr:aminotransferase class V-fold PLP-dependent enzyme [Mesomycoplasma neurolyticum]VEU59311.1 Probable cysteine desulfurase [Mesomycoplasma neurolyticum]
MNNEYRKLFPMLKKITYFDNAALSQKPYSVIEASREFYENFAISNRTSESEIGIIISQKIDNVRVKIAKLTDSTTDEVIFTSGTTQSLNNFANMIEEHIFENDEILISYYNHSSHIIPWIELAKKRKAKIVYSENLIDDINEKTKLICYSQQTNNFQIKLNFKELYEKAKKYNSILINDAAQAISTEVVSLKWCHVIAFSANKMYGPTGLGALIIKKSLLDNLRPATFGGGSVEKIVDLDTNEWNQKNTIEKFEPGTLNLAAIWQFEQSLNLVEKITLKKIKKLATESAIYLYDRLLDVKDLIIHSKRGDLITLFTMKNTSAQDVASYLGHNNIYVRSGIFCSKLIPFIKEEKNYVRVSIAFYNNKEDVDILVKTLQKGGDFLDFL